MAVPTISTGFTDSHFLREALGCVAYGFSPLRADPIAAAALVHSADERISPRMTWRSASIATCRSRGTSEELG